MEFAHSIVLDANILLRAVLGVHAQNLVNTYAGPVWMCAPQVAFDEAKRNLTIITARRGWSQEVFNVASTALNGLETLVNSVDPETYVTAINEAQLRIGRRDPDDVPILALALLLDCPVWTEDHDFFGTGVPIWTSDRVELYFSPER